MTMWWTSGRGLGRVATTTMMVAAALSGCAKETADPPFMAAPMVPVPPVDNNPPAMPDSGPPKKDPPPLTLDSGMDEDSGVPMTGDGDMTPPDMAAMCANPPAELDVTGFPVCDMCEKARCVGNALLAEDQKELLAACDDANTCVPESLLSKVGIFTLKTCSSVAGSEGRCISKCVPQVADQADRLEQDICEDDELCAPCTDPLSGEDTGVCGLSCDPGPADAPLIFQDCCDDGSGSNPLGKCVPAELAGDQADGLPSGECDSDGFVCAPNLKIEDQSAKFPSCMTVTDCSGIPPLDLIASIGCGLLNGVAGACVPTCTLSEQPPQSGIVLTEVLQQATCDKGSICAPCISPADNMSTGACE